MTPTTKKVIKFIHDGVKNGTLGTFCVGKLYRDGQNILTVLWPELYEVMVEEKLYVTEPQALQALKLLIPSDMVEANKGRDQRHRFTTRDEWNKIVDDHKNGDGRRKIQWDGNFHCMFLPMDAFGLTPEDFKYFRKAKAVRQPKPKRKLKLDKGTGIKSTPLKLSVSMANEIKHRYPTIPPCTVIKNLVKQVSEKGGLTPSLIEGLERYSVGSDYERINVSLSIKDRNGLISIANKNQCGISDVLRSIINGHPHWSDYLTKDFA